MKYKYQKLKMFKENRFIFQNNTPETPPNAPAAATEESAKEQAEKLFEQSRDKLDGLVEMVDELIKEKNKFRLTTQAEINGLKTELDALTEAFKEEENLAAFEAELLAKEGAVSDQLKKAEESGNQKADIEAKQKILNRDKEALNDKKQKVDSNLTGLNEKNAELAGNLKNKLTPELTTINNEIQTLESILKNADTAATEEEYEQKMTSYNETYEELNKKIEKALLIGDFLIQVGEVLKDTELTKKFYKEAENLINAIIDGTETSEALTAFISKIDKYSTGKALELIAKKLGKLNVNGEEVEASPEDIEQALTYYALGSYSPGRERNPLHTAILNGLQTSEMTQYLKQHFDFTWGGGTDATKTVLKNKDATWHAEKQKAYKTLLNALDNGNLKTDGITRDMIIANKALIEGYSNETDGTAAKAFLDGLNASQKALFTDGGTLFDAALATQRAINRNQRIFGKGSRIDTQMENLEIELDREHVKSEDHRKSWMKIRKKAGIAAPTPAAPEAEEAAAEPAPAAAPEPPAAEPPAPAASAPAAAIAASNDAASQLLDPETPLREQPPGLGRLDETSETEITLDMFTREQQADMLKEVMKQGQLKEKQKIQIQQFSIIKQMLQSLRSDVKTGRRWSEATTQAFELDSTTSKRLREIDDLIRWMDTHMLPELFTNPKASLTDMLNGYIEEKQYPQLAEKGVRILELLDREDGGFIVENNRTQDEEGKTKIIRTIRTAKTLEELNEQYFQLFEFLRDKKDYAAAQALVEGTLLGVEFETKATQLDEALKTELSQKAVQKVDKIVLDARPHWQKAKMSEEDQEKYKKLLVQMETEREINKHIASLNNGLPFDTKNNPFNKKVQAAYKDMMGTGEWHNFADSTWDTIMEEVAVNGALILVSGGAAALARSGLGMAARSLVSSAGFAEKFRKVGLVTRMTKKGWRVTRAEAMSERAAKMGKALYWAGRGIGGVGAGAAMEIAHTGLQDPSGFLDRDAPEWFKRIAWSSLTLGAFQFAGAKGKKIADILSKNLPDASIKRSIAKAVSIGATETAAIMGLGALQHYMEKGNLEDWHFTEELFHALIAMGALQVYSWGVKVGNKRFKLKSEKKAEREAEAKKRAEREAEAKKRAEQEAKRKEEARRKAGEARRKAGEARQKAGEASGGSRPGGAKGPSERTRTRTKPDPREVRKADKFFENAQKTAKLENLSTKTRLNDTERIRFTDLAKKLFSIQGNIPDKKTLKKTYTKLSRAYHPDQNPDIDEKFFKKEEARRKAGEARRKAEEARQKAGEASGGSRPGGAKGPSERTRTRTRTRTKPDPREVRKADKFFENAQKTAKLENLSTKTRLNDAERIKFTDLAKELFSIQGNIPNKQTLKKTYNKLVQAYHPDQNSDIDEKFFKIVSSCYKHLKKMAPDA